MMCKVYTDVGGMNYLYHVCPPVRKITHSLKLVDYLHVQADKPWYNYCLSLGLYIRLKTVCLQNALFTSWVIEIYYPTTLSKFEIDSSIW